MDNSKDNAYYIEKLLDDMTFIVTHMKNVDYKAFSENEILQDSMMFRLIQVSENVRKLSDEYKEQHPVVPWTAIYGLRNRSVHDYGNVDLTIVFDTVKDDIPSLMEMMKKELKR